MRLTLLLPGLSWPREILRDTVFDLDLPALSMLLGRASVRRLPESPDARLARMFGIDAPLPAAPLRLLGDGGAPGDGEWICLDPVHLRLEARTAHAIVLDDPARLSLTAEESAALRETVAPLFAEFGELSGKPDATAPGRWHLHLSQPAGIESQSLQDAVGRTVDHTLPAGPQGERWRRLLAEAQTLLFEHPVNRARRETGRPAANSLWPWGAGRLPDCARLRQSVPFDAVLCDDPVLTGLARAANLPAAGAPAKFSPAHGRTLVRLDSLVEPTRAFDAMAWREALTRLEADWFAPLLSALRTGRCRSLSLWAGGEEESIEVELSPRGLWKFWRRPRPLSALHEP
ncbi:MAG: hypothetical protein Q8O34_02530 [Rhodocyclaceae bacterium]|nr:hypothetical protein [Rhodocyclaceae bacterium]